MASAGREITLARKHVEGDPTEPSVVSW